MVRDTRTGAGKGIAFVLFKTQAASLAALKRLEGRPLGGRKLRLTRVTKAAGGGKPQPWQQGKQSAKKVPSERPVVGKRKGGAKRPAVAARKLGVKKGGGGGGAAGVQKRQASSRD